MAWRKRRRFTVPNLQPQEKKPCKTLAASLSKISYRTTVCSYLSFRILHSLLLIVSQQTASFFPLFPHFPLLNQKKERIFCLLHWIKVYFGFFFHCCLVFDWWEKCYWWNWDWSDDEGAGFLYRIWGYEVCRFIASKKKCCGRMPSAVAIGIRFFLCRLRFVLWTPKRRRFFSCQDLPTATPLTGRTLQLKKKDWISENKNSTIPFCLSGSCLLLQECLPALSFYLPPIMECFGLLKPPTPRLILWKKILQADMFGYATIDIFHIRYTSEKYHIWIQMQYDTMISWKPFKWPEHLVENQKSRRNVNLNVYQC